MELTVNIFFNRIEPLTQKGLPSLVVINDKLMIREDYVKRLKDMAKDFVNLSNIRGNIAGKAMPDPINNPIFIEHDLKQVFIMKPNLVWYIETYEIYCMMIKVKILDEEHWSELCNYQEEQDKKD